MMSITAEEALDAYEAARHRLPASAPKTDVFQRVGALSDIANRFDVFLLDAFGVLNVGETVIPGVPDSVTELQNAGKRVLVVSNAASVGTDELLKKYTALGYDFARDDIVTSRETLSSKMNGNRDSRWGVVAPASADLADLGLSHAELLADDPAPYEACDSILLIGTGDWTHARQDLLETALRQRSKPVLVANPDIVAPRETGFSVEPGHIAHRLADVADVEPEFYGKPFANIFDMVFDRLGDVDRTRVVMVGDSLHTDILGARAYGIASALVPGFGFFAGGNVEQAIERTGITPDYLVERP
ncbi:MAG: HAD hydrolase-like protein [Paracoccaceae bacterium]|nr:HAD hydrolase-like protein [Paracoccaceae bacterium]